MLKNNLVRSKKLKIRLYPYHFISLAKGIASAAPFLVVEIPETFIANFKHSLISIFFSNPEAKAPLKASPAL